MKVANEYNAVFTLGVQNEEDFFPRQWRLRRDASHLIISGTYLDSYIMCQFPLQRGVFAFNIPDTYEFRDDQPDCQYMTRYERVTVWTDYFIARSCIELRFQGGSFRIPIPYGFGKEIQRIAKGLFHKNGIKFY